ncbi:NUDIX domain-containing protein [Staphylococcus sp. 17KM0847]|uniref:NUDIX hydrolase n=1 Tax=Staphylococcus sp. 17KM0847 TaxID=2583989 RepID=UPI0015DC2251|nr:NUDIX domain-containing protein [Staphylococcus sp. 17KM0847]QLK86794.1 NUDIX domain-containing protein [Staphylococcus sp. 17KM0847]
MIRCVCLVIKQGDYLRLVQVRNRKKYYFPGGKIERGETLEEALIREVFEELHIELTTDDVEYIGKVVGPAYPQQNTLTELNGFRTKIPIDWSDVEIHAEITDIEWIHFEDKERMAPAVIKWIEEIEKI